MPLTGHCTSSTQEVLDMPGDVVSAQELSHVTTRRFSPAELSRPPNEIVIRAHDVYVEIQSIDQATHVLAGELSPSKINAPEAVNREKERDTYRVN